MGALRAIVPFGFGGSTKKNNSMKKDNAEVFDNFSFCSKISEKWENINKTCVFGKYLICFQEILSLS